MMTRMLAIAAFVVFSAVAARAASPQASSTPVPEPQVAAKELPVEAASAGAVTPTPSADVPLPSQGYTYKAEGRRDPFVTLIKRGSETAATTAAGRAAGLAGLGTGEVTLRGILASQGAYVAMLLGSDDKTYIVRSGDKLADGTIRSITADTMVIMQQVKDPVAQAKQREVRKMLRQTDGTN